MPDNKRRSSRLRVKGIPVVPPIGEPTATPPQRTVPPQPSPQEATGDPFAAIRQFVSPQSGASDTVTAPQPTPPVLTRETGVLGKQYQPPELTLATPEEEKRAREMLSGSLLGQGVAGLGEVYESVGGVAKWAGYNWLGNQLKKEGKKASTVAPAVDLGDISWKSALDPEFWAKVPSFAARMTPFTLSLVPAMVVGYAGGAALGGAIGLGAFGSAILGAVGGSTLSRPLESLLEAGGTNNEAVNKGMSPELADKAATNVFLNNLKLSGFDALELITAFAPPPVKIGSKYLKPFVKGAGVLATAGLEGTEEVLQQKFQTEALGDKFDPFSPETKQAAFGGALFGGLMGGAGAVFNSIKQQTIDTMPPTMAQKFDTLKTDALKRGMNDEQAGLSALDEIAKTPEGKKIVEQAAKWVEGQQGDVIPKSVQQVQGVVGQLKPETNAEIQGLREFLANEPASAFTYLVKTTGGMKGELPDLTIKQYKELTGKQVIRPSVLTPDGQHVKWHLALDELATENGYEDGETFREAIMQAWEAKQSIKQFKGEDVPVTEAGQPEAGLQAGLFGEQKVVRPVGKGKTTQISMDDAAKLAELQRGTTTPITPEVTPTQPTPTAPIEGVTPALPVGEGIPPQVPPPPPETGITAEPPSIEPSGKVTFANLQDTQAVIDYSTKQDVSRWIANIPAIKQLMSRLNPSAIANTPGEKAVIARAVLREEGTQKAQGIISYLNELGSQKKVFGSLDDKGFLTDKLKGLALNDVRTNPSKYAAKLSPEQKVWIDRAHQIEVAKLKFMRDNGIEIQELAFEEGGVYAGRRVYALMSSDGELLDSTFVGAGPARVGKKTSFEKRRFFKTAQEAQDAGYRLLPEDEALSLNTRAAYNRVADKQMSEWLLSQVPWRTTGASEELILAAESAKLRSNSSKQLLAALNRAVRGERIPDATINSIARAYPEQAAELKRLIPEIQAGRPTATDVKNLDKIAKALIKSDKADSNAAINARARARERAMSPTFGESMIMHPAFSGKIFTGPEAKQLADTLRNALEPKQSEALEAINKVNALVRYFKLAGDFSPLGIQLIFLSGQNPKIYGGAAASIPKILFDTEWQSKFLSENKDTIDRHPGLLLSKQGTEFTEAMQKGGLLSSSVNVWPKQEALAKKLALATPRAIGKGAATVLEPFQRVFEGTLDYAGIKMAEGLEHLAKTPAEMAEVDQFINEFRGVTSSAKLGVTANQRAQETATLLAPRYNRAIAALLADATKGAATFGQSGIRNRLAIQGLTKGIAAISAMAVAISLALGEDEDDIKEHFDPNSGKFFTWNVAGTNIGPGTKVRSVVKLLAQSIENPEALLQTSMDNPALRFIRGNLAPVAGATISILTGKDYIGDPVRSDVATFTKEMIVKNFMPIWVENVIYEGGGLSQRLIRGAGEFFGGRAYPETEFDQVSRLRERYAAQHFGKEYEGLNNSQRDTLRQKHDDLAELETRAKEEQAIKGSDIERFYFNEKQRITDERNDGLDKAAQSLLNGEITKYDYDKQRGYIRPYYSGGREVLWSAKESLDAYSVKQMEKWLDNNIKPEDKALGEYQEYRAGLIEGADLPVDWDVIERELESYLIKYPPDIEAYIIANLNNWINDLPQAAKQVELQRAAGIEDESWWDDYRNDKKPTTPSRTTRPSTPRRSSILTK